MTEKTLRFNLGDREFSIGALCLRQHREIDLANLREVPSAKEQPEAATEDVYNRMARTVISAVSAEYPDMTVEKLEAIPDVSRRALSDAYAAVMKFAGYEPPKEPQPGETQPSPEIAQA